MPPPPFRGNPETWHSSAKTVTAKVWGASDNLICVSGLIGDTDEFNTTSHPMLRDGGYVATLLIDSGEHGCLNVHAFYDGYWSFAISPGSIDQGSLPDWPCHRSWGTINDHSETLELHVPRGTTVVAVERISP